MPDADALQIRLLGPLEVVVGGAPRELRGVGERAVLSLLALEAGRVISADRIIDALWGERLPANPANALQLRVSKLRRALRDIGADAGCIATRPPGYVLDVAPAAVDALRFARDVADARRAADDGSPRAAQRSHDALALWRGPPLVEFAAEAWAVPEVRRLEELRLAAIEEQIAVELDAGQHAELVDQLEALVAQNPLRERYHEQLMLALYRSGRQADALAAYRRARDVLADELGLEPSAALTDLEAAILRQDPSLAATVRPQGARRGRLPARLATVIGREEELAELVSTIREHRLVTVTRPRGTGKTTVALLAARQLIADAPDGAWFVDLSAVTEESDVADAIAGALTLPRTDPLPGEAPESRLARRLTAHAAIVVLDNCEHLLDACATVVERLLRSCPDLRVLATSREPLGVPGERQFLLGPLATPPPEAGLDQLVSSPAVRLFADRAGAVVRGFVIDEANAADIGLLCRQLDGIPLALELAAARTTTLPVAQIVARLDDRFRLLTSGSRTAHARQRTLRATVDWSHDLLTGPEQMLFRRLAVFRGGVDGRGCGGDLCRRHTARR
ncbi:MAG TPA: BTAD domain-containing putative transcriptional regulator [Euzebyales bacterium]|nr:BTAD domain-containing putative transcriptional regulator [Euzebyales bacterium]